MTKSETRRRKFWGWGYEDERLTPEEANLVHAGFLGRFGISEVGEVLTAPTVDEVPLVQSRLEIPQALADFTTDDTFERLNHTYGKSFHDCARALNREFDNPVDLVSFPRNEDEIDAVLDWAEGVGAAVIPYGGGSSVCAGTEPPSDFKGRGTLSLDMKNLDQVLEIDSVSRAARIQGGIYGPALEKRLAEEGMTMRHFPQSFEFSTLGGWIATRGGGHYASVYTHIDDFVESTRMLTPRGAMETRRLPGSGAGPSPDRMVIGSEGIFGVITEAWMRLQHRVKYRASLPVFFDKFLSGAEAVRAISQSGLFPTNCRLIDRNEAVTTGAGDGSADLLVLGFESADHPVEAWMARALEIVADHGGVFDRDALKAKDSNKAGAAGAWRNAFIRAPYMREEVVMLGGIVDTFETACTWDVFPTFHEKITAAVSAAITQATGKPGFVTCRFTHIYPDGPAPYFTFWAMSNPDAMIEHWWEIKRAAGDAVIAAGGTITHHHAVGREHKPWYDKQRPELFASALKAAKGEFDPAGIMNPGVLV